MTDTLKSIAVAASIIILGLFVVSAIFGTMPADELNKVDNETITADVGNATQVEESYGAQYYDNETITNASGTQLQEGTDYDWDTDTGEVSWYDTANVSDGEEMSIDYAFDAKPQAARDSIGIISNAFTLGAVAVVVVVVTVVLATLGGFDRSIGGGGRL